MCEEEISTSFLNDGKMTKVSGYNPKEVTLYWKLLTVKSEKCCASICKAQREPQQYCVEYIFHHKEQQCLLKSVGNSEWLKEDIEIIKQVNYDIGKSL